MKQAACLAGVVLALATGGCGGGAGVASAGSTPSAAAPAAGDDWRRVATPADRDRLRRWRDAWLAALPRAQAADPAAIAAQGALFQPDLALAGTAPAGRYRCRVFKLGAAGSAMRDFTAYPAFDCRIADEGRVRSFYKETGSQRPVGLLFADGDRTIFLGTLLLGDERAALQYGQDRDRDMAGVLQRIGERRWRLVLPYPRFESLLDVIELVPAD